MQEIYTKEERTLIDGAKWAEKLQELNEALKLDLMLLELEASVGLMDGMPIVKEGGADGE